MKIKDVRLGTPVVLKKNTQSDQDMLNKGTRVTPIRHTNMDVIVKLTNVISGIEYSIDPDTEVQ